MVANPTWSPLGAWTNVLDDGDPWTSIPPHWEQGWFTASGISPAVNQGSPQNNSANISIGTDPVSGNPGTLLMKVANIGGTNYGCLMNTNPGNSGTSTGLTFTPPYAFECQVILPGPAPNGAQVPNWVAIWADGTGSWPVTGEVDCLESLGRNNNPLPDGDWNSGHVHDFTTDGGSNSKNEGFTANMSPHPYGLHTVGYYRTATQVQFYYDGILVGTLPIDTTAPHYLILTHTYNTTPDVIPSTLGVRWVRVWTPGGTGGTPPPQTGMVVTATASGSQDAPGVALTVKVLNNAITPQAGAVVRSEVLTTPDLTITPVTTGSVIYGAVSTGYPQQYTNPQGDGTTMSQNVGDAATNQAYGTFRSAGTVTAGTPVTVGPTGPAAAGHQMIGALAEIQPLPGQAITEDASSPAPVFASALSASTAGFSPPGGALLVAQVALDYNTAGTPTVSVTVTDSTGLTWTKLTPAPGAGGQDLASVWVAGGTPAAGPPPIVGPPATTKQLIVSAAPAAGTDPLTGQNFPQGVQVGGAIAPQVAILPTASGAQIQYPIPAPRLANVPNMASSVLSPSLADLIISGPALALAGLGDWVQMVLFSNDNAGDAARLEFRYIDPSGNVAITAAYNGSAWLFSEVVFIAEGDGPFISGETWHTLSNPAGVSGTLRVKKQPWRKVAVDMRCTFNYSGSSQTFTFGSLPDASYEPTGTIQLPLAIGGTPSGIAAVFPRLQITAAGAVSAFIPSGSGTAINLMTSTDYPTD